MRKMFNCSKAHFTNKIQNLKTHTVLYFNFQELHAIGDLHATMLDYARLFNVTGEFMSILEKTRKYSRVASSLLSKTTLYSSTNTATGASKSLTKTRRTHKVITRYRLVLFRGAAPSYIALILGVFSNIAINSPVTKYNLA